jgi:hypothetical protein
MIMIWVIIARRSVDGFGVSGETLFSISQKEKDIHHFMHYAMYSHLAETRQNLGAEMHYRKRSWDSW